MNVRYCHAHPCHFIREFPTPSLSTSAGMYYLRLVFTVFNFTECYWYFLGCISVSNTRDSVSSRFPNTEQRDENMTRSVVFLTKFGEPMKHCLECLMYLLNRKKIL